MTAETELDELSAGGYSYTVPFDQQNIPLHVGNRVPGIAADGT